MAVTKAKKKEILEELLGSWKKSKSLAFSGYQGLTVKDMSALRKELRQKGGEYKVAKKTLIRLAGRKLNSPEIPDELFSGAVGVVFSYEDPLVGLKTVFQFGKAHPEVTLLGGLFEGKLLNASEAKMYAMIPDKKELLAKLVGSMKAPISGFHGVLAGVLRNFVYALVEYQKKMAAATPPSS